MLSKYKFINFKYNLQEIKSMLPDISEISGSQKIYSFKDTDIEKLQKILSCKHKIFSVLYFHLLSNSKGRIHIDGDIRHLDKHPKLALNIPIHNGDCSTMYWYNKISDVDTEVFNGPSKGTPTPTLNRNDALCVAYTKIDKPIIVKICDWHSISNTSDTKNSEILSIRFYNK